MSDISETTLMAVFATAHPVIKLVIVGLLIASSISWAIIVDKMLLFRRFRSEMIIFEREFWGGRPLWDLYDALSPNRANCAGILFASAWKEWKRSRHETYSTGSLYAAEKTLDLTIREAIKRLEGDLLLLASLASAGPFVGMFGTVWGIMTSFRSVASSKYTSFAGVAPGVAEALITTAISLLTAIPSLIAYNILKSEAAKAKAHMQNFAAEFWLSLSHAVDNRGIKVGEVRKSGHRYGRAPRNGAMANINMTPFIDVMLVLVIVFMTSTPQVINLPTVDLARTNGNFEPKYIAIAIDYQGQVFLMDKLVGDAEVFDKLQELAADRLDVRIYFRASKVLPYGRIANILNKLTSIGYKNVAIVTDPLH